MAQRSRPRPSAPPPLRPSFPERTARPTGREAMRLAVALRPDSDPCLFARLPPPTARTLHELARAGGLSGSEEFIPLEIEVADGPGRGATFYASYNGGAVVVPAAAAAPGAVPHGAEGVIELHPSLHPSLRHRPQGGGGGGTDGAATLPPPPLIADVRPLPLIRDALSVRLEPLSPSDWEALEVSARDLEGGYLLGTVSVVYPGQVLRLALGGNGGGGDAAFARVLPGGFVAGLGPDRGGGGGGDGGDGGRSSSVGSDDSSWCAPDSDSDSDSDSGREDGNERDFPLDGAASDRRRPAGGGGGGIEPCLRLVADTEVVVTPYPRPPGLSEPSAPLRVHPTADDVATLAEALRVRRPDSADPGAGAGAEEAAAASGGGGSTLPPASPPPLSAAVHPDTLRLRVPGWGGRLPPEAGGDSGPPGGGERASPPRAASAVAVVRRCDGDGPPARPGGPGPASSSWDDGGGDGGAAAVARVSASEGVPRGHIALHRNLRYQLGLNPLYDFVELQLMSEAHAESAAEETKRGILSGRVEIDLAPATVVVVPPPSPPRGTERGGDGGGRRPWRRPDGIPPAFPPPTAGGRAPPPAYGRPGGAPRRSRRRSRSARLRSFLSSRVEEEVPACGAGAGGGPPPPPLASGALVDAYPGPGGGRPPPGARSTTYALELRGGGADRPRDGGRRRRRRPPAAPAFIFANDLPPLLLRSLSSIGELDRDEETEGASGAEGARSFDAARSIGMPSREHMLNLLPPIRTCSEETPACLVSRAVRHINRHLSTWEREGVHSDGLMLTGEIGTGKTHYLTSVAARLRLRSSCATVYLDCKKLQSSSAVRLADVLDELTAAFDDAALSQPCVLLLDDLDALVPNIGARADEGSGSIHHQQINPILVGQVKVISDHIQYLMEVECARHPMYGRRNAGPGAPFGISVVCTCQDQNSLHPALRSTRLFSSAIGVPALNGNQRAILFDAMLECKLGIEKTYSCAPRTFVERVMPSFGKKTEGYRARDLQVVASRVGQMLHVHALGRCGCDLDSNQLIGTHGEGEGDISLLSSNDMESVLLSYKPIAHQSLHVMNQVAATKWSSVGGLFRAKATLTDVLLHPVRYSHIYQNSPITLPRGILLYGPPGCGKTYLLPALARECNLNLVACRGPELLDKYIGASEAKVRQLFARAYMAAPAMLFLDDFDALAPRRGTDHTGVTDRVVNQLLTFLDGVEDGERKGGLLYIAAATSRPDKIDPALLRPGRLEKHVYVGFPESSTEWTDLFTTIAKSRCVDRDTKNFLCSKDFLRNADDSMRHIKSFSAADMKAVFDTAYLEAVHEHLAGTTGNFGDKDASVDAVGTGVLTRSGLAIRRRQLLSALKSTRPSLLPSDRQMLRNIYEPFYHGDMGKAKERKAQVPPPGSFLEADADYASGPANVFNKPQLEDRKLKTTLR